MVNEKYDRTFRCVNGHHIKESEMNTIHCPECDESLYPVITVMLVQKASGNNYSLEAGIADGERNFDHHGDSAEQPAPCIDARIPVIPDGEVIEITHLDADTMIGIVRMLGDSRIAEINPQRFHDYGMPWRNDVIDLVLMARIDVNGSSFLLQNGLENTTRQWMVGILQLLRELNFPRWQGDDVDVTDIIAQIIFRSDEEIIQIGKKEMMNGEKAYQKRGVVQYTDSGIGLWEQVVPEDSFDPSRPYADGYKVVVIYRRRLKQIGVYVNPDTDFSVNRILSGIQFAGREKAAGSPRGEEFSLGDSQGVFDALNGLFCHREARWIAIPLSGNEATDGFKVREIKIAEETIRWDTGGPIFSLTRGKEFGKPKMRGLCYGYAMTEDGSNVRLSSDLRVIHALTSVEHRKEIGSVEPISVGDFIKNRG